MAYARFAEIYDRVMECVDYPEWADYLLRVCRRFNISMEPMLNLACGTGSLEKELIKRQIRRITSMDASRDMLAVAERKFADTGETGPEFLPGRMEEFDLGRTFSLITCLYDSFNYLLEVGEARSMMACVLNHLVPGGAFIFDVTTEYNIIRHFADYTFSDNFEDYSYIWENTYNIEHKVIRSHVTIFAKEGDVYRKYEEDHYQRIYSIKDLQKWAKEVGFEILGIFSEFTLESPDARTDRVHLALRKPGKPKA